LINTLKTLVATTVCIHACFTLTKYLLCDGQLLFKFFQQIGDNCPYFWLSVISCMKLSVWFLSSDIRQGISDLWLTCICIQWVCESESKINLYATFRSLRWSSATGAITLKHWFKNTFVLHSSFVKLLFYDYSIWDSIDFVLKKL
jgi:hypothetical protein